VCQRLVGEVLDYVFEASPCIGWPHHLLIVSNTKRCSCVPATFRIRQRHRCLHQGLSHSESHPVAFQQKFTARVRVHLPSPTVVINRHSSMSANVRRSRAANTCSSSDDTYITIKPQVMPAISEADANDRNSYPKDHATVALRAK